MKFSEVLNDLQYRKDTCETDYYDLIEDAKKALQEYNDGLIEMDMPKEMIAELYYLIANMTVESSNVFTLNFDEVAQYLNKAMSFREDERYVLELWNVLASNRKNPNCEQEALEVLEAYIERTGGTAKTLAKAGDSILVHIGDVEKGVDYFHRAIEMDPDRIDTYQTYFDDLEEMVEEYPEYIEDAILCLTRIIDICSNSESEKCKYEEFDLDDDYYYDEEDDDYYYYDEEDDDDINIPQRYYELSNMYYKIQNFEKALECLKYYLEEYPDDEEALEYKMDILRMLE